MLETMGMLACLRRLSNNAISTPKLPEVGFIYLGFDWLGTLLVITIELFQPYETTLTS